MFATSATHRGAPFVGRVRERGILLHLLQEGLEGSLSQVRVAGPVGVGRRRLIADTLRRGPDAEWIHLAPGGVTADLPRWIRTELLDLLDTYPEAPVPSWSLHVLGRWAPALSGRARIPALGREPVPGGRLPELLGAAMGSLFRALTGWTLVVVDAGLWPDPDSLAGRALVALAGTLRAPGTVLLAAVGPEEARLPDRSGTRTLELGPLAADEIEELVAAWTGEEGAGAAALADWLTRVTAGHPFFLHETVRWLEEMGQVRVDDEHHRIELLDRIEHLPMPLTLHAVLDARYGRLPPPSARLLHLLARLDGTEEIEAVRRRAGAEDETFDEAIAVLRRREFLLQRSSRRPLALASPLWREVANEGARRFTRLGHRPPVRPESAVTPSQAPLARILRDLDAVRRDRPTGVDGLVLARIGRRLRGRTGPAWDGARGRLAVLAARRRLAGDRTLAAARWVRWGLRHLSPDYHPALRRALLELEARRLEAAGLPREAADARRMAREEAVAAGHAVSAARILAAEAEGLRRRGRLEVAGRLAAEAESALAAMGFPDTAALAGYTRVAALVDERRLEEAVLALAEAPRKESDPGWMELHRRLEALEAAPLHPALRTPPGAPSGWGWGLDRSPHWLGARETLRGVASAAGRQARDAIARLAAEADALAAAGYTAAAADLEELRLGLILDGGQDDPGPAVERLMARVGALETSARPGHLAAVLRDLPAAQLDAVRRVLTPLHLHAKPPPRPPATRLRLMLTGLPRVENRDASLPLSLWPEWWRHLALRVVSADLLGETTTRVAAEEILARAHEPPGGGLEGALFAGNTIWCGGKERAEGIRLQGDRLVVSWDGLTCDARDILALARAADEDAGSADPAGARHRWEAVLNGAHGAYLPGVTGEVVGRARAAVAAAVTRAVAGRRRLEPDPDTTSLWRWLESVGPEAGMASYAAAVSARRGRRRLARALAPGSP